MSTIFKDALARYGLKRQKMTKSQSVVDLIKSLRPQSDQRSMVRVGSGGDGAYLVPDDFDGLLGCYSPGVANSSSFERFFADRGVNCYLADYSVNGPAEENNRFFFEKKFLGSTSTHPFIRLHDWVVRSTPEHGDLILQMDIEGAEYEVILDTDRETLSRFRIMTIEFHGLDAIFSRSTFPYIKQVFSKILENFVVVHIHPNNCARSVFYKNIEVPPVLEITFYRKDRFKASNKILTFPHELDEINVPGSPDVVLPPIWYRLLADVK